MFNLSVVNIIPDAHKDAINQIAELCGCGSNNLSVKLQGEDGIYWGCHSWWKPEDYAVFSDAKLRAQRTGRANERTYSAERLKEMVKVASIVAIEGHQRMIEHLYARLMLDGDAQENWTAALSELGLTLTQDEVV